jgi:hypothetical protein
MTSRYFSDLASAKKIKMKLSKNKDKSKNIRYNLVPEIVKVTLADGKVEIIDLRKKKYMKSDEIQQQ